MIPDNPVRYAIIHLPRGGYRVLQNVAGGTSSHYKVLWIELPELWESRDAARTWVRNDIARTAGPCILHWSSDLKDGVRRELVRVEEE